MSRPQIPYVSDIKFLNAGKEQQETICGQHVHTVDRSFKLINTVTTGPLCSCQ